MCQHSFLSHAPDTDFISIIVWMGCGIMDVPTAFLYAPLIEKRDVCCRPPQVLVKLGLVERGVVWKLKKALYGLRTSPRAWKEERDKKS